MNEGMNLKHLEEICEMFNLGSPRNIPTRVYGGLLHVMWQVETDKGRYAVKQISQDIDLNNEVIRESYELTERIASRFSKKGVGAVSALEKAGRHLVMLDEVGYLVYRWVEGRVWIRV